MILKTKVEGRKALFNRRMPASTCRIIGLENLHFSTTNAILTSSKDNQCKLKY